MSKRIEKRCHSVAICLLISFAAVIGVSVLTAPALAASETILYSFAGTPDGATPAFKLTQDAAGNLYGVTLFGGVYGGGTAFELSPQNGTWVEKTLHSFGGTGDGFQPAGGLLMDSVGNLYGVADGGLNTGIVYRLSPDGHGNWTETILKTFGASISLPLGGLTMDAHGKLYGVAGGGGTNNYGKGAAFRLSPPAKNAKIQTWKYAVLYQFRGSKYNDSAFPNGDLVFDAAGNLYGTADRGGLYKAGTVFELSPGTTPWKEKILYNFHDLSDGGFPFAGLIFDAAGNLYGTTGAGGSPKEGTVFELSQNAGSWTEMVLYSFTGLSDGGGPVGPLTLRKGSLYGTAACGGNQPCGTGDGVVFELSPSGGGWSEQVLHTFTSTPDGSIPLGGVNFDSSGNLYGTTFNGGGVGNNGVVYEISP